MITTTAEQGKGLRFVSLFSGIGARWLHLLFYRHRLLCLHEQQIHLFSPVHGRRVESRLQLASAYAERNSCQIFNLAKSSLARYEKDGDGFAPRRSKIPLQGCQSPIVEGRSSANGYQSQKASRASEWILLSPNPRAPKFGSVWNGCGACIHCNGRAWSTVVFRGMRPSFESAKTRQRHNKFSHLHTKATRDLASTTAINCGRTLSQWIDSIQNGGRL